MVFSHRGIQKKSNKVLSMEDIRAYYGSTDIETNGTKKLKQAYPQVKKNRV